MATAVASRLNDTLGSSSLPSPKARKAHVKQEDNSKIIPSIIHPDDSKADSEKKDSVTSSTANAPLAPPPRPSQAKEANHHDHPGQGGQRQEGKDHFSKEPNPFENAFGAPSDTPGKTQLPGVTSLTSPAPLLAGGTPGWPGSLRSGPLSPAMLTGPTNNDYFSSDHHFAGSFPTPNESSLRTGLTPGGGGSMFPHPSPNSQAIFNAIQSGGATPGTLDFHRTAMHARASTQNHLPSGKPASAAAAPPTSVPNDSNIQPGLDSQASNQNQRSRFEHHDANDAANGLYMLAQASNGTQGKSQPFATSQSAQYHPPPPPPPPASHEPARHVNKTSIGSAMSGSTQNDDDGDPTVDAKPAGRGRGKKNGAVKASNARRKADDSPKTAAKRQKGNSGRVLPEPEPEELEEEEYDSAQEENGPDGRKLTDEEKRRNFLERNRIAALKCRQRKKQWLANLQGKVELYGNENEALANTVTQLREEIVGLKTLLLAHKDCPISQQQGLSGMAMHGMANDGQQYGNPYHMGMQQGNMQRR